MTHTKYSHLCSDHFEPDCYEDGPMLAASFGIETKRQRILKKTAVPTLSSRTLQVLAPCSGPSTTAPCSGFGELLISRPTPRSAFAKRERKRVSTRPQLVNIYYRKSYNNDGHILDI